ncbi:hypothetical protein [Oceanobacillus salinisoli]|uniref:hypothetical protein n=1 Tax=Oceanobacillus salinisoli TaxID=2678611 RepID=UPI0012E22C17|nr:hypothetical protein [Oceanobacillus salinisoli]
MNKVRVIVILLILSLIVNGVQFYLYENKQSESIDLEKVIIINEFSERAKNWRNFNQFIDNLSQKEKLDSPISQLQSDLYWELAKHNQSIILKGTKYVSDNAEYSNYSDYLQFINDFDREYEAIINRFKTKITLMNNEQLVKLSSDLDVVYKLYINDGIGEFSIGENIQFEPNKEILSKVINELILIKEDLEAIE